MVTRGANRPETVFIEREALVLSVETHILVEVATAGEVQNHAVVLVVWTHPHVQVPEYGFALLVALHSLQIAHSLLEKNISIFNVAYYFVCEFKTNLTVSLVSIP